MSQQVMSGEKRHPRPEQTRLYDAFRTKEFLGVTELLEWHAESGTELPEEIAQHNKKFGNVFATFEDVGLGSLPSFEQTEEFMTFFKKILKKPEGTPAVMLFRACYIELCNLRLIWDSAGKCGDLKRAARFTREIYAAAKQGLTPFDMIVTSSVN